MLLGNEPEGTGGDWGVACSTFFYALDENSLEVSLQRSDMLSFRKEPWDTCLGLTECIGEAS